MDHTLHYWCLRPTELTDGSMVYDVVGVCDYARVVINCIDLRSADELLAVLSRVSAQTAVSTDLVEDELHAIPTWPTPAQS